MGLRTGKPGSFRCSAATSWSRMAYMRCRVLLALAVLLAGVLLFQLTDAGAANTPRTITLFFTGYVHGNYGPCG